MATTASTATCPFKAGRRRNERCRFAVTFPNENYDMWLYLAPEDVQRKGLGMSQ